MEDREQLPWHGTPGPSQPWGVQFLKSMYSFHGLPGRQPWRNSHFFPGLNPQDMAIAGEANHIRGDSVFLDRRCQKWKWGLSFHEQHLRTS